MQPGPLDGTVLTLQSEHRSAAIWLGQDLGHLTCRRADGPFRNSPPLHPRVLTYLQRAGFYGVYRIGHIQLDWALITALVERWRVETHTFHLPVGECTITLQDVEVLTGLPVDGEPVIGTDVSRTVDEWQQLCLELLGVAPSDEDIDKGRLKVRWLSTHFRTLPQGADDVIVQCYARAHIMLHIGGSIFADKSQNKVKLMFLPLLQDLEAAGRLSWGSAALATLYRNLCVATRPDTKEIGGPLIILQLWAWERFSHIRPFPTKLRDMGVCVGEQPLPDGPRGLRWHAEFNCRNIPTHVLTIYRDEFDKMKHDQMVWQPYTDEVIAHLPAYCHAGRHIWRSISPLISFDVVEWHRPDRVLRQFGLRQMIPMPCDTDRLLHGTDRRGRSNYDWAAVHAPFVLRWSERRQHIAEGDPEDVPITYGDPYLVWYRRITRLLIGNPTHRGLIGFQGTGGMLELMTETMTRIYHRCQDIVGQSDTTTMARGIEDIRGMALQAIEAAQEQDRLAYVPQPEPTPMPAIPMATRGRRRGVVAARPPRKTSRTDQHGANSTSVPSTSSVGHSPAPFTPSASFSTAVEQAQVTPPVQFPTPTNGAQASAQDHVNISEHQVSPVQEVPVSALTQLNSSVPEAGDIVMDPEVHTTVHTTTSHPTIPTIPLDHEPS